MKFSTIPLAILTFLSATQAFMYYSVNQPAVLNNDMPLYPLDTTGLSGRFTGYWSNTTGIEYGDITFQLWFLTFDARTYSLSLVAIRNPSRLWDLYRPFIVWTANRDDLVGENATLSFGSDGDLKLQDNGRTVWSTNTTGRNVTSLCVSNLGNIFLEDSSGEIVWQSLDSPSDVFPIQVGIKPGARIVSWSSERNTSSGPYILAMEDNRLVLYRNLEPYWVLETFSTLSTGLFAVFCWQPDGLISIDLQTNTSMLEPQHFISGESCQGSNPLRRVELLNNAQNFTYGIFVRLTVSGDVVVYTWDTSSDYWYEAYKLSANFSCFLPGQCGSYGICSKVDGQCTKSCPATFEYDGQSGACKSTRPALLDSCSQGFEVVRVPEIDYFSSNFSVSHFAATAEECSTGCERNCSCKAAFFKENSCFFTYGDVESLTTGSYTAFLKVTRYSEEKQRKVFLKVALAVLVPSLVVLISLLACVYVQRSRKTSEDVDPDAEKEEEELEMSLRECMPRRFTYKQLEQITAGFSRCLGQGGYGNVYKGSLDGVEIAVKKLQGSNQTSRDFYSEIASLARTNHLNLVKFLGFCAEGPLRRLLVYEFVPNGSLDKWIFGGEGVESCMSWELRFQIAVGTARGLSYLHEECAERIIHLDLKPENVLVDVGFVAKIADFGLSRLMNREVTYLQMTSMRGTPGYLAPEYLQVGTITEKSDVFSFGVLLLEIITGCRNKNLNSLHLTESVTDSGGGVISSKYVAAKVERMKAVAYLCVQDDPELRPSMSTVVRIMEGLIELPEVPPLSNLHFFLGYRSKMKLPVFSSSSNNFKFSSSGSCFTDGSPLLLATSSSMLR